MDTKIIPFLGTLLLGSSYVCQSMSLPPNKMFLFGTFLIVMGYALMSIHYYHKINVINEDTKPENISKNVSKNKYILVGAVMLFLYYVISHIIEITPHTSNYDIFGVVGFMLLALQYAGFEGDIVPISADVSLVMYYLLAIISHHKITNICDFMQLSGRLLMLIYYGNDVVIGIE